MTKVIFVLLMFAMLCSTLVFANDSLTVNPGERLFIFEGKGAAVHEPTLINQNRVLQSESRRMRLNDDQVLVVLPGDNDYFWMPFGAKAVLNGLGPSPDFGQAKDHETVYLPTPNEKLRKVIVGTGAPFRITRATNGMLSVTGTKIVADDKREIERRGIVGKMPPYGE